MAAEAELARAFRRFVAGISGDPSPGTPETLGNQATPVMSTGDNERPAGRVEAGRSSTYADRDDTGPAYRNAPNFFGWCRQHGVEMQGMRESFLDLGAPAQGATVTLDPNVVSNFFLKPAGDVTLAFKAPEAAAADAPATSYLYGLKVWVLRVVGKKVTFPAGILWDSSVLDPDGDGLQSDSLLGAATAAAWESYTFVVVPGIGTWGYVASHNGATATV